MSSLSVRHPTAVIVTIEGLGTNLIGAYGNAICPTPQVDRFAAQSLIADQFWMDCSSIESILISMWTGEHHSIRRSDEPSKRRNTTARALESPGLFVTDSRQAADLARTVLLGDSVLTSPPKADQTAFSNLAEQALDRWIPALDTLPWLWIHSQGLMGKWDAPYDYRCSMCDEGDPLPPRETAPPRMRVDKNTDPDVIFGWACGAGAQAMVIDEVWEWLESALQQLDLYPSCLFALAGVLGYPLGEHRSIGYSQDMAKDERCDLHLHSESLHTPLILRPGNMLPLGVRFEPFLQPRHFGKLIHLWLERDRREPSDVMLQPSYPSAIGVEELVAISSLRREAWPAEFRAAFAVQGQQSTLQVPGWGAFWDSLDIDSDVTSFLYAMPEDRWQQNEISSRAPEILDRMRSLREAWLSDFSQTPSNIANLLSTMDESLWRPHR